MYYLRSRYYSAILSRFINSDILINTHSIVENTYSYCSNSPMINVDPSGYIVYHLPDPGYEDFEFFDELLLEEHELFVATICGEAIGESPETWAAVACVIQNRRGRREWSSQESVTDVITSGAFNGYQANQYYLCMEYLKTRDGNHEYNELYEHVISVVMPIYFMDTEDTTDRCTMFYSPREGVRPPSFSQSPKVEEVIIEGVNRDKMRFFRYKDDVNKKHWSW